MFDRVMQWLDSNPDQHEEGFDDHDIRVSVAALFYHMVSADGQVKPEELERLSVLLKQRFALNDRQLTVLIQEGETMERSTAGVFPFTVILNRELNQKEKLRVFSQLQNLALADGTVHELEQRLLDHVKTLLRLT